jgi:hypothetical protein
MPHVTPLELGLAVAAVVIAFGPKRLPSFKRPADANKVDISAMYPAMHAAGRAPSPLSHSVAPPSHQFDQPVAQPVAQAAAPMPQQPVAQYAQPIAPPPVAQRAQATQPRAQAHPTAQSQVEPHYALVGTSAPLKLPDEF